MVINYVAREILLINTDPELPGAPARSDADTVAGARTRKLSIC